MKNTNTSTFRRAAALLLCFALILAGLAGCGQQGGAGTGSQGGATEAATAPDSGGESSGTGSSEAAGSENGYVYPTDVPIILFETPVPQYNPSETQQTVTAVPAYTQEPQPIITPLPLVTPVQEQQQDISSGEEYTQTVPADTPVVSEPVSAAPLSQEAAPAETPVPDASPEASPVPAF